MWKLFGSETDVGKQFLKMYSKMGSKESITYPSLKLDKSRSEIDAKDWN